MKMSIFDVKNYRGHRGVSQKRVGGFLMSYRGFGAVAGIDHRVIGKNEEFFSYRLDKREVAASREIGPAHALVKKRVSGEHNAAAP